MNSSPSSRAALALFACAAILILTGTARAQVTNVTDLVNAVNYGQPDTTVHVGAGTFQLTAPLRPKSGMVIKGAGVGSTIITHAPSWAPSTATLPDPEVSTSGLDSNAYLFSLPAGNQRIEISHMTLRGPQLHGAIFSNNNDDCRYHHLLIDDFLWCGIRTFSMDRGKIHDCEFINAGGTWSNGNPGTNGGISGGAMFVTWMAATEIWNNRITRTKTGRQYEFYGVKGRQGRGSRIHHNTIHVNFSIEFAHENDHNMEIDHNVLRGVISVPKYAGGSLPSSGVTFHIHHNYFTTSYAIEFVRNGIFIHDNLFNFSTTSDGGNLISGFGSAATAGPGSFYNNLVKNPGRGVYWVNEVYNNMMFRNNHVIANTTATPRTEGLFGFNSACNFSTITIKDNIIECIGQTRPLVRNSASNTARIENNTLINVSGTGNYANPNTGARRGPVARLYFGCGVNSESTVDHWNFAPSDGYFPVNPDADAMVRNGSAYAGTNYGGTDRLEVKASSDVIYNRQSYLKFDLSAFTGDTDSAKLVLPVTGVGGENVSSRAVELRLVATDSWSEGAITWSSKPAPGGVLRTFAVTAADVGGAVEIDVTAAVNAERGGDGTISFVLVQPTSASALIVFGSRESARPPFLKVRAPGAVSVGAIADAYTRDGTYASANYGTSTALVVKAVSTSGFNRRSYLKFPVASLANSSRVLLLLGCEALGTEGSSNHRIELRQVASDAWTETGITWSNQPAPGALLNAFTLQPSDVGGTVAIDVTGYVNSEAAGDGTASFVLVQPAGTNRMVTFSAREGGSPPELQADR
jgi:nitrous oxidase accessory protein